MTTKPFVTNGSGIIVSALKPDSWATKGNNGLVAPADPGYVLVPEAWSADLISAVRCVPSENAPLTAIGFHVANAAGSNDQCDIGIMDVFGDLLWHSGLVAGLLNSTGMHYVTLPSPAVAGQTLLDGGRPYYLCFGYGAVGTYPAELTLAMYAAGADYHNYSSPLNFGYAETVVWASHTGAIEGPTSGPTGTYSSPGQGVAMIGRTG